MAVGNTDPSPFQARLPPASFPVDRPSRGPWPANFSHVRAAASWMPARGLRR